jgi:hypothetical protein
MRTGFVTSPHHSMSRLIMLVVKIYFFLFFPTLKIIRLKIKGKQFNIIQNILKNADDCLKYITLKNIKNTFND